MCLFIIAIEYNGPLEASHAHIDYDGYDIIGAVLLDSSNWIFQISYFVELEWYCQQLSMFGMQQMPQRHCLWMIGQRLSLLSRQNFHA